jgi:16S rRNA G966 N2-methylase RsmD
MDRLVNYRREYSKYFKGSGNNPYPYLKITEDERNKEYSKLVGLKFSKNEKLTLSIVGNKVSNYYFQQYRVKTKSGKWSHFSKWKDNPDKIRAIDKSIHKNKPNVIGTSGALRSALNLSGNSIGQFKPYVAVYIYQKFKPKRILDISAGWGDRLIGALSQNIDYIGIDSNKRLEIPYKKMINDYKNKSSSNVKMIFEKSETVDYTKLPPYDLIFTSPPYFSIEQYQGMKKYDGKEDFVESYWIPTIKKSWASLESNGVMALNMPEEMSEILIPLLGKPEKIIMPIRNRFGFKDKDKKCEFIYWWKKGT